MILVYFRYQVGAENRPKIDPKCSWAVPERSADVPGDSRARIIDFSMVLGGFGGGEPTGAPRAGHAGAVWLRPPKYQFSRQTKHQWVWARVWAMAKANGPGLGCLGINAHSHLCAKRDGGSAAPPGTSVLDSGIKVFQIQSL